MSRPRGEQSPAHLSAPPPLSTPHLCVSVRCVTATGTVTARTAGLRPSVSSGATAGAWTADPPGTVPSAPPRGHVSPDPARPDVCLLSSDKDTSLRDGLLVFFFLVLPLLALGAFGYLRRKEVLRRLGLQRRRRSQAYQ